MEKKTDLPGNELQMALTREYPIPLFYDTDAEQILNEEIEQYNLQILYGGRFMHLLSRVDKGEAMSIIMEGYRERQGREDLQSVAIGDSLNDFAMLSAADHAVSRFSDLVSVFAWCMDEFSLLAVYRRTQMGGAG